MRAGRKRVLKPGRAKVVDGNNFKFPCSYGSHRELAHDGMPSKCVYTAARLEHEHDEKSSSLIKVLEFR